MRFKSFGIKQLVQINVINKHFDQALMVIFMYIKKIINMNYENCTKIKKS